MWWSYETTLEEVLAVRETAVSEMRITAFDTLSGLREDGPVGAARDGWFGGMPGSLQERFEERMKAVGFGDGISEGASEALEMQVCTKLVDEKLVAAVMLAPYQTVADFADFDKSYMRAESEN